MSLKKINQKLVKKNKRLKEECNELKQKKTFSENDLHGIDFAMWDCDPTTFTYKDIEVTMVAYNTDCAEKDEIIKKQTHVVSTQTKRVKELLKKIEDLKKKIEKKFSVFHDIAEVIDPDYEMNGHLNSEKYEEIKKKRKEIIINDPKINFGDLLFIGSTYETRQEYGFVVVKNKEEGQLFGGEDGSSIPLDNKELKDIKYKKAILKMKKDYPEIYEIFSYWDEEEENEIENNYKKQNMWD